MGERMKVRQRTVHPEQIVKLTKEMSGLRLDAVVQQRAVVLEVPLAPRRQALRFLWDSAV
jgi:hypothetical protein